MRDTWGPPSGTGWPSFDEDGRKIHSEAHIHDAVNMPDSESVPTLADIAKRQRRENELIMDYERRIRANYERVQSDPTAFVSTVATNHSVALIDIADADATVMPQADPDGDSLWLDA